MRPNHNMRFRSSQLDRWSKPVAVMAVLMAMVLTWLTSAEPTIAEAPSTELPAGMTPDVVRAVDRGLTYLANTQRRDGSWRGGSSGYGGYPVVMTSLAGMAMLAGGSTPESGPYSRNVQRAMNYVLAQVRQSDGMICSNASGRSMYSHGFGMLFLAQCYGMELSPEKERQVHDALTKAVQLTARSQSDLGAALGNAGGWYYTPESNYDEGSVTVTQLQALRACRNAGIAVPRSTIERAVAYLKYCQNPDGGIAYSADSRGSGSRTPISAAAVACFYAAGIYDREAGGGDSVEAQMVGKLWDYLEDRIKPGGGDTWGYYYYSTMYYAEAMYMRGGESWDEYYPALITDILRRQNQDGSWSGGVSTPFDTGVACIILQLPYGYLPICQR